MNAHQIPITDLAVGLSTVSHDSPVRHGEPRRTRFEIVAVLDGKLAVES